MAIAFSITTDSSNLRRGAQVHAQMQTEMQGERQRMTRAEKEMWGAAEGRPPAFLFCCAHPLPGVPLTFLSAFHTEIHGKSLLLSNANANENANANAKVSRHLFRQQ